MKKLALGLLMVLAMASGASAQCVGGISRCPPIVLPIQSADQMIFNQVNPSAPTGFTTRVGPVSALQQMLSSLSPSTPVFGGTNNFCLYDNNGFVGFQACGSAISIGASVTGGTNGSFLNVAGGLLSQTAPTGSGSVVLADGPTLSSPFLGMATATSINGLTITPSTGSLSIPDGVSFATSGAFNAMFNFSAPTNVTFPPSGTLLSTSVTSLPSLVTVGALTGGSTGAGFTLGFGSSTITGVCPVANGCTGLASGNSGGILGYTAAGVIASTPALTADLPVIGGGAGVLPTVGTRQGNTTKYVSFGAGGAVSGNVPAFDVNGNLVDSGSTPGGGGGSGTVASGTANDLGYYNTSGTTISPLATANNGVLVTSGAGVPSISSTLPTAVQGNIIGTGALASGSLAAGFTAIPNARLANSATTVNGQNCTLGATCTVAAAAGTLTGATLAAGVTASSLTSVGALTGGSTGAGFTLGFGTSTITGQCGVANGCTGLASGSSGGIPYFSAAGTMASSAALTANLPVFGGGAGASPISGSRSGNTTQVMSASGSFTSGNFMKTDASGNAVDGGSVAASLSVADQVVTGGANITSLSLSAGSRTVDCGLRPTQFITNNGAFTLTAPANDGSCVVLVTNGAAAGAITFSGFSVGASTGDAYATTNTQKFSLFVWRINSTAGYRWAAHQ